MSVKPSVKGVLVTAGVAFFLATLVAGVWVVRRGDAWLTRWTSSGPQKRYSTEIADGAPPRDFKHFAIDLLSFKTCRLEKLRRGPVTLGAFNVLVLEEVVVHLVPPAVGPPQDGAQQAEAIGPLIEQFKTLQGLTGKAFSSVRIKGLVVNRWAGGTAERLFTAATAEGGIGAGRQMRLDGCVIFEPGGTAKPVGAARLELQPDLALVYTRDGIPCRLPLAPGGSN